MSKYLPNPRKEDDKSEIDERSEEALLDEEIRNQQRLNSFIESEKNGAD